MRTVEAERIGPVRSHADVLKLMKRSQQRDVRPKRPPRSRAIESQSHACHAQRTQRESRGCRRAVPLRAERRVLRHLCGRGGGRLASRSFLSRRKALLEIDAGGP